MTTCPSQSATRSTHFSLPPGTPTAPAAQFNALPCILIAALLVFFMSGCARLPDRPDISYEPSLSPASDGPLAALGERFKEANGAEASGFHLLIESRDALESRLALIDLATQSIDIQYFIWKGDAAGLLLFDRLYQAADRGVSVRIIVDDIWLGSSTRSLIKLNSHPNLELRIFNPNPSRDSFIGGYLQFLGSFQELNQRMHNKLMIVDGHVLVAGGRNIGDEYFGLGKPFNFTDLDVLTVGAVVEESIDAFDDYWNDDIVYPVSRLKPDLPVDTLATVREEITALLDTHKPRLSSYPIHWKDWRAWLSRLETGLITGEAHFLQDDPIEIDGEWYRLVDMISYIADPTEQELILVSPYLIPVDTSLSSMRRLGSDAVRVRLLTNSLASTNHTLVNSHYKKYRRRILATGAELHEFNYHPSENLRRKVDVAPVTSSFLSLHTKAILSDRRTAFIGSLNFDPRAVVINSENGVLIQSPELGAQLADYLLGLMEGDNAWRVSIGDNGRMQWQSTDRTLDAQPSRGGIQSIVDLLGQLLPIESQL